MPGERRDISLEEQFQEETKSNFIKRVRAARSVEAATKELPFQEYKNFGGFMGLDKNEMDGMHAEANREDIQPLIEQIRAAGSEEEARQILDSSKLAEKFEKWKIPGSNTMNPWDNEGDSLRA